MTVLREGLAERSPADIRKLIRANEWMSQTAGLAHDYVQANLVILPHEDAEDFREFCKRNPKPCPVLDITDPGSPVPMNVAPNADLRTDLPRYRVYESGKLVEEPLEITRYWRDDLVAFLLGCSFTFEHGLVQAGVPLRHIERGLGVPMYRTNQECEPAGRFHGPLVVSMRPIPKHLAPVAIQSTARYPAVHGAPVHIGDPGQLDISDIMQPDWGDPPVVEAGDVPVFWACGVTPQAVAMESKPTFMISHAPGHMFITDLKVTDLRTS
ncbi:putative hydro-lyase [soil metagenome]